MRFEFNLSHCLTDHLRRATLTTPGDDRRVAAAKFLSSEFGAKFQKNVPDIHEFPCSAGYDVSLDGAVP